MAKTYPHQGKEKVVMTFKSGKLRCGGNVSITKATRRLQLIANRLLRYSEILHVLRTEHGKPQ
jgi:TATA-box binding protein (TBP) (component of TFIID and TFIIIB)